MTGYPHEPTPSSQDESPAEVVGQPAPRDEVPQEPGEAPEGTVPKQKSAARTSETMPPSEGMFRPDQDPDAPE